MTNMEAVYLTSLEKWAVEIRLKNGFEFLIALDGNEPALVRFTDEGLTFFCKQKDLDKAMKDAQKVLLSKDH